MKTVTAMAFALSLGAGDALAQSVTGSLSPEDLKSVSPALARTADETLAKRLWARPGLSPRDRSIATLTTTIVRNQSVLMASQMRLALENSVTPAELSEIITHLAFYAGWGNGMVAAATAKEIFAERGIGTDQMPAARPELLPIDEASEATRAQSVEKNVGPVAPGLVQDTTDVLFKDLWLRPGLTPRDRSLVTVSALISAGQMAQLTSHLNRAMDNGLTRIEAGELISHLAYYAGWPNAFSAATVAGEVFAKRD